LSEAIDIAAALRVAARAGYDDMGDLYCALAVLLERLPSEPISEASLADAMCRTSGHGALRDDHPCGQCAERAREIMGAVR